MIPNINKLTETTAGVPKLPTFPPAGHVSQPLGISELISLPVAIGDEIEDGSTKEEFADKKEAEKSDLSPEEKPAGQGTLLGVFFPCVQNIFGVIVFIRMSWIVGEMGALEAFEMVFACATITFSTSISLAAVATNGRVPAGGAYFMISKFLGPEFGGSVGMLFYIGTSLGCSMYIVGFAEIFLMYLAPKEFALLPMDTSSGKFNNYRVYGTFILLISATIVYFGVNMVSRFAAVALACVFIALSSIYLGFVMNANGNTEKLFCQVGTRIAIVENISECIAPLKPVNDTPGKISQGLSEVFCGGNPGDRFENCETYFLSNLDKVSKKQCFPGLLSNNLFQNIYNLYSYESEAVTWSYDQQEYTLEHPHSDKKRAYLKVEEATSFLFLLGVFFPSVTGIMAGSNRSGDLDNPSFSIPLGTMGAILTTTTIYLQMVVLFSASIDRLVLRDKFGESVGFGMIAGHVAYPHPLISEIGALLSTFGAGLQSLTGAPRILAAIANDNLFLYLDRVAAMDKRGNPTRALVATALIAELGIIIGDLDIIAPLLSMFFILFYAAVNAACVTMSIIDSPNWRPTFKYFHWSISLIGLVYCIAVMFL